MIDLRTAARLDGSGRGGRPAHVSAYYRRILRGVRLRSGGRLHLKATRKPSGWFTTRAWMEEFDRALTADRLGRDPEDEGAEAGANRPATRATPTGRRSAADRRAASRRAGEILKSMGC